MIRELIERTTGMPLISHGGENLILKEIQRGIRTKISSADYYYYILILHNTILWRLIFLLTTKRTKNRITATKEVDLFDDAKKNQKPYPSDTKEVDLFDDAKKNQKTYLQSKRKLIFLTTKRTKNRSKVCTNK